MEVLHPGRARGEVAVLDAPLSFWGGTDLTGHIRDPHHPQHGMLLAGRVVVMAASRGSSSSSSTLAEQVRLGTAPAAILLTERDPIILLGAIVAAELYGVALPVLLLEPGDPRPEGVVTI
jgi:predicted aconitase with swiveling domain